MGNKTYLLGWLKEANKIIYVKKRKSQRKGLNFIELPTLSPVMLHASLIILIITLENNSNPLSIDTSTEVQKGKVRAEITPWIQIWYELPTLLFCCLQWSLIYNLPFDRYVSLHHQLHAEREGLYPSFC